MRAVNLIPSDQRSGGSVGTGRSEGVVYAVLVLLAGVALMAVLYGKAKHDISSKQGTVATLNAQAATAQAQAQALAPYSSFVSMGEERAKDVATLVDSRFDWAHAFHEFGRVLSAQVSINSLYGAITTTPATTGTPAAAATPTTAAGATSSTVASSTPPGSVPTFTLTGCAKTQDDVALMLQQLRAIDGVAEVTLQSSSKANASAAASTDSSASGGCSATDPSFSVGVTFDPLPSASEAGAVATKAATSTVSDKSTKGGAGQ